MRRFVIAGVVVVAVGGLAFAGFRLRGDSKDVGSRFEAAVARAQEAESKDIKVVYEFEDDSGQVFDGTLTLVRKGEHFLVMMTGDDPFSAAFGKDAAGPYTCFAGFLGAPGCADDEAADKAEQDPDESSRGEFLDMFGGGFTPAKFLEWAEDDDMKISDSGTKKVAGLEGECFDVESEEQGDGTVCFSPKEGLLLFMEWDGPDAPGKMTLRSYSRDVSDEDVARPNLDSGDDEPRETVALTRWLAEKDARCALPEGSWYLPTALGFDADGELWLANFDQLIVFDPTTCAPRPVKTGQEGFSIGVAGMAAETGGGMIVSFRDGSVVRIGKDGTISELLSPVEGGNSWFGGASAPALFPDGSIAVARIEGEEDKEHVVIRRIHGGTSTVLRKWDEAFLGGQLLAVPGVGVASTNQDGEEFHIDAAGKITDTKFRAVLPGFTNCGVYASPELRWEQFDDRLIRMDAEGDSTRFLAEGAPEGQFGCEAAALDPDGKSLWFLVSFPGDAAGLYEVALPPSN